MRDASHLARLLALVRLDAVAGSPKFERAALRWLNRLIDEGDLAFNVTRHTLGRW